VIDPDHITSHSSQFASVDVHFLFFHGADLFLGFFEPMNVRVAANRVGVVVTIRRRQAVNTDLFISAFLTSSNAL
jgi:hypothetical protein